MAEHRGVRMLECVVGLLRPEVLLPVQQITAFHGPSTPERRLVAALLEDAVNCFQKYRFAKDRRGRRLFWEAAEWLMGEEGEWAFSFERVCEVLGLDPDCLRRGLQRGSGRPPVNGTHRGRTALSRRAVFRSQRSPCLQTGTERVR